jgi:drug/metabolite transporter (DMT)-like permease
MFETRLTDRRDRREAAGALASVVFVCLASVRDVYLGGLFQRLSPLDVAVVAFGLCTVVCLPIALVRAPDGLHALLRRPADLFWVNATSAAAWIAFFYALRTIEPLLVQILFAGIGPLSVVALDRLVPAAARTPLHRIERYLQTGLLAALGLAAVVAIGGLSGVGAEPVGRAALGVALALGAGVSISANTVTCRRLNDEGVPPIALISVRFVGAVAVAGAFGLYSGSILPTLVWSRGGAVLVGASLLLIVFPNYVNQIGIALASPLTVRVVLALAPLVVFVLQWAEGRLSPSPYSFATASIYGTLAIAAALARGQTFKT